MHHHVHRPAVVDAAVGVAARAGGNPCDQHPSPAADGASGADADLDVAGSTSAVVPKNLDYRKIANRDAAAWSHVNYLL